MSASDAAVPARPPRRLTPLAVLGEGRLARLACVGDEGAFAEIFRRYHRELYRYLRAILGSAEDAQDALQAAMTSALVSLPGEEREISLRPWLYRVAHNQAITILRRRTAVADPARLERIPDEAASGEVERRQALRELVADLGSLPERQRAALTMRELSGLGYGEIGAALDASPAAARQAVYEARVALVDLESGREMQCDVVRRAISDGDGRVLRARGIRAHLRNCDGCSGFKLAIDARSADLQLLAPPLPALAAAGILSSILGGEISAGGAGIGGGGLGALGKGALATTAAKSVAVVAVGASLGVAGLGVSGAVDLPLIGSSDSVPGTEIDAGPAFTRQSDHPAHRAGRERPHAPRHGSAGKPEHGHDRVDGDRAAGGSGAANGPRTSHGNSANAPGQAGSGVSGSHGNSAAAHGAQGTHGNSGAAHAAIGTHGNSGPKGNAGGNSATAHANAGSGSSHAGGTGGSNGRTPPATSNAGGNGKGHSE